DSRAISPSTTSSPWASSSPPWSSSCRRGSSASPSAASTSRRLRRGFRFLSEDEKGRRMLLGKVLSVADAVALVRDGDTVATTGYGGNGTPDQLVLQLERRFLDTGAPRGLTLFMRAARATGRSAGSIISVTRGCS